MWIDTHAHLDYETFGTEQPGIIKRALEEHITAIITIGIDMPSSRLSVKYAGKYPCVYASVGIHPNDAHAADETALAELRKLAQHPGVVAFGETGLDYYWKDTPADVQKKLFIQMIELAAEFDKPIIVHNRDAHDDVINVIMETRRNYPGLKGVMHCFSGDRHYLDQVIETGFYVSFAGNITYKKSHLPELLPHVPMDRLLIETDAPFLSPVPHRGKRNEPAYVRLVGEKIAECLQSDPEKIASITTENAKRLFRINPVAEKT